jgi:hypothetical protein
MTGKALKKLGLQYMQRLGMVEWMENAQFILTRGLKDSKGNRLDGQSWWLPETRHLYIQVRAGLSVEATHETVIHELLHALLEGHKPPMTDEYDESYEWGLNRAAKAYYASWKEQ